MNRRILLCFFCFLAFNAFSQNDWQSGFIIDYTNDTVVGYIDNRPNRISSVRCYFKYSTDGIIEEYTPEQISGYRMKGGKFYIAKKIPIGDQLEKLVFVEFLIKGIVNLYFYKDETEHYYVEKNSAIFELKNTSEIKEIEDVWYEKNKEEYKGLMTYLLKDANMQTDIRNAKLQHKNLIRLAKKYHETVCTDEGCIIFEKEENLVSFRSSVLVGPTLNSFNFGNRMKSNFGLGYMIGYRLTAENIFDWNQNYSLNVDFVVQGFTHYTFKAIENYAGRIDYDGASYYLYKNPTYSIETGMVEANIKTLMGKFPISLNYTLTRGKVRPKIGLGISQMVVIHQDKNFTYQFFENELGSTFPKYMIGLNAAFGLDVPLNNDHLFMFNLSYEYMESTNLNEILRLQTNFFNMAFTYSL